MLRFTTTQILKRSTRPLKTIISVDQLIKKHDTENVNLETNKEYYRETNRSKIQNTGLKMFDLTLIKFLIESSNSMDPQHEYELAQYMKFLNTMVAAHDNNPVQLEKDMLNMFCGDKTYKAGQILIQISSRSDLHIYLQENAKVARGLLVQIVMKHCVFLSKSQPGFQVVKKLIQLSVPRYDVKDTFDFSQTMEFKITDGGGENGENGENSENEEKAENRENSENFENVENDENPKNSVNVENSKNSEIITFTDSEIAIDIFYELFNDCEQNFLGMFLQEDIQDILINIAYISPSCNFKMVQELMKVPSSVLTQMLEQSKYRAIITVFLQMQTVLFKDPRFVNEYLMKNVGSLILTGSHAIIGMIIDNHPDHHQKLFEKFILDPKVDLIAVLCDKQNVTAKFATKILINDHYRNKTKLITKLSERFFGELILQDDPQLVYRDLCLHGRTAEFMKQMFLVETNIEKPFELLFNNPVRLTEVLAHEYGRRTVGEYSYQLLVQGQSLRKNQGDLRLLELRKELKQVLTYTRNLKKNTLKKMKLQKGNGGKKQYDQDQNTKIEYLV
jgi:hypothetical protein